MRAVVDRFCIRRARAPRPATGTGASLEVDGVTRVSPDYLKTLPAKVRRKLRRIERINRRDAEADEGAAARLGRSAAGATKADRETQRTIREGLSLAPMLIVLGTAIQVLAAALTIASISLGAFGA